MPGKGNWAQVSLVDLNGNPTEGGGVLGTVTVGAGSAKIGVVTTDQTTHGTTDLVAADITKVAGAAIAQGHGTAATAVRVELPTDGTGVVGLAAGAALVGKVGIDQTTPGTTNNVTVSGNPVTYTDRSGTIAAGGTRQQLAASNASRKGFFIQNNSTGNLWINFGVNAVQSQPSLLLLPNAYFEIPEHGVSTAALDIVGPTTGQTFTAKEW